MGGKGGYVVKDISSKSYRLLLELYHLYLLALDSGEDEFSARFAGSASHIRAAINSEESESAIAAHCWELARHGYLETSDAEDTVVDSVLTDEGIRFMEQRFPRGLADLLHALATLGSVLP